MCHPQGLSNHGNGLYSSARSDASNWTLTRTDPGSPILGTSDPMDANPFGILTFIVAPAILTNASSVNALATSNRLGRATDRARAISALLEDHTEDADPWRVAYLQILGFAERRI